MAAVPVEAGHTPGRNGSKFVFDQEPDSAELFPEVRRDPRPHCLVDACRPGLAQSPRGKRRQQISVRGVEFDDPLIALDFAGHLARRTSRGGRR